MYFEHFGLDQPPFKITPNQEFFYSGANRGAVLDALVYAITSGEGIVKVVGEVGTGKTMLCRMLEGRLPASVEIIYLANPSLPHDEILYAIADELGLQLADQRPNQVIRELQNCLIEKHAQGHQVVVFIDEAQAMPLDSLEEIRLLSNLETGSSKLLQIVLFGQPEFDQHINQTQIRQLKERITHSFYLHPFSRKEMVEYLAYRMHAAGYRGPSVFSLGALKLMHRASHGLIRRINILADKALLAAFSDDTHAITVKQVKAAIRDSGFTRKKTDFMPLAIILALTMLAIGIWIGKGFLPMPQPAIRLSPPKVAVPAEPIAADMPQNALQRRLDSSRVWLNKQNGAYFTIQLMLTPPEVAEIELQRIQALARLEADQVFAYATHVGDKPVISIVTGVFPTIREAREAIAKLPSSFLKNRPLLRTFKGIREET
jgi:type II secretory pathway predicted ATPase ExeA